MTAWVLASWPSRSIFAYALSTKRWPVPKFHSLHLCHGHFNRERSTDTGYEPIIEALGDIHVGRLAMEFAAPQSHGIDSLGKFPRDKVLLRGAAIR